MFLVKPGRISFDGSYATGSMLQIGYEPKSDESISVTADGSRAKQIMLEIDKLPFKDTSAISASVKALLGSVDQLLRWRRNLRSSHCWIRSSSRHHCHSGIFHPSFQHRSLLSLWIYRERQYKRTCQSVIALTPACATVDTFENPSVDPT